MDVFKSIFDAVIELATYDIDFFGFVFSPLDFWLTTAILHLLVDLLMWLLGNGGGSDD